MAVHGMTRTNLISKKSMIFTPFATILSLIFLTLLIEPVELANQDFPYTNNKQQHFSSHHGTNSQAENIIHRPKRHGPTSSININNNINRKSQITQWNLSHNVLCEPISQLNDLRLSCPNESQFIVIIEAYYSDLYPEIVCPKALNQEGKLNKLTGSQLVAIFRQLYSPASVKTSQRFNSATQNNSTASIGNIPIQFAPTLGAYSNSNPFCLDDLKQSFAAKCSGRQKCRFSRHTDHHFSPCAQLKPGHVFARYLCVDNGLLIKYCNADTLLASHSSVLNRVKRAPIQESSFYEDAQELPVEPSPEEKPDQVDTLDFGFVASPGYPMFYATPKSGNEPTECGWTIEAEVGQQVTVKLLDASLAPSQFGSRPLDVDSAHLNSDLTVEDETARKARQLLLSSLRLSQPETAASTITSSIAANKVSNIQFQLPDGNESGRKVVFRIDQTDYDLIRSTIMDKLQQVESRCEGYDKLIVRDVSSDAEDMSVDSITSSDEINNDVLIDKKRVHETREMHLVTKLPVTLFKNQLINFANRTIFRRSSSPDKRIDYRALLESLNPLELIWFYQQNVSLCSNSQQDQLSSEQEKNRISFTSSSHKIQVNLASGHIFNPTNRGILFWYHKHGCPATLKAPSRSRIVHQNNTIEIFECFQGFIFNDTRQPQRIRRCSHLDQRWFDLDLITLKPISSISANQRLPACVFAGDLNSGQESWFTESHNQLLKQQQLADEVAVEVVGVEPTSGSLIEPEVVIGLWNDEQANSMDGISSNNQAQASGLYGSPSSNSSVEALLSIWHSLLGTNGQQPTETGSSGQPSNSVGLRSIMTHDSLKERKLNGRDQSESLWARSKALFDRRLLVPAIVVLFLFLIINLVFYVIFLVALPKLIRCVCLRSSPDDEYPKGSTSNNQQNAYVNINDSTLKSNHSSRHSTLRSQHTNKLAYYESDYSVSMGMSL